MNILIPGGAGYIGSHTCIELLESGHDVTVVDNLSNCSALSLQRVEKITGKKIKFHKADIRDKLAMLKILKSNTFDAVIHFAGLKAVGESVAIPEEYYDNNVNGTLVLCKAMKETGVKNLIFSSSATVYGDPKFVPITEDFPTGATNPYGRTKLFIEEILKDISTSDPLWKIILLRYFNSIGAHISGLIGENPNGIPNNLMPFITQVALGKRPVLQVYGDDYKTVDGTGVRDYIHATDLARGHLAALEKLKSIKGVDVFNLGTGRGYSVLEVVKTFEKVSGRSVPYDITSRRPGDIAECYADSSKAERVLGWRAEKDIEDMCRDSWNWQFKNPDGYV